MKRVGGIGFAAAVVVIASLAGCSSTPDEVTQYVKQASAAEQSAALGGRLHDAGKAPGPETSTLFEDAMKELTSADQSLAQLRATGSGAHLQHRALTAVREAIDTLLSAQRELQAGAVSAATLARLRHGAAALRALEQTS